MPEKETLRRAAEDRRAGKSASSQAGEFVREEIHHIREGKHGARSAKQAIAIGLSKARRAGVELPAPDDGPPTVRRKAKQDLAAGARKKTGAKKKTAKKTGSTKKTGKKKRTRSEAMLAKLQKEGNAAASPQALSRHATAAARERTPAERSASARKAARTKGATGRRRAARKAARTRAAASATA